MRVLVCGSRHFDDWLLLHRTLYEELSPYFSPPCTDPLIIIEGGAIGADFLSRCWAKVFNIPVEEYPANWKEYSKAAGPIRNKQMLEALQKAKHEGEEIMVIAFLAPDSIGTKNMIEQAQKANIPIKVINI